MSRRHRSGGSVESVPVRPGCGCSVRASAGSLAPKCPHGGWLRGISWGDFRPTAHPGIRRQRSRSEVDAPRRRADGSTATILTNPMGPGAPTSSKKSRARVRRSRIFARSVSVRLGTIQRVMRDRGSRVRSFSRAVWAGPSASVAAGCRRRRSLSVRREGGDFEGSRRGDSRDRTRGGRGSREAFLVPTHDAQGLRLLDMRHAIRGPR